MIVACEKCQTRFQLDDERVPQEGIRVRCSQCKHAFVIRPSGGDEAEVIDRLAGEAARTGRPSPPQVAQDLSADPAEGLGGQGEEESDWQFNNDAPQDLREGEDDDSFLGDPFDASESVYESEPEEFDREALGHPDGCGYLRGEVAEKPPIVGRVLLFAQVGAEVQEADDFPLAHQRGDDRDPGPFEF